MTAKGKSVLQWSTLFAIAPLLLTIGCTRTVIGGGGTDSPDKNYCVYARIYGAYRRAFVDETPKKVRISIVAGQTNETMLLRREYRVRGSDVTSDARWDEHNNLTVVIYDYGRGISRYDARKTGSPTNHLRTLVYRLDPKTRRFTEDPPKS